MYRYLLKKLCKITFSIINKLNLKTQNCMLHLNKGC